MQQWETFPNAQVTKCLEIAADIIASYPVTDVVGHHDIAIMGKFDPGPLFDLDVLKALVTQPKSLGFKTKVKANDTLNLRRGPDAGAPLIRALAAGSEVHIRSIVYGSRAQCIQPSPPSKARYLTKWASVDVDGSDTHAGFVNMSGLTSTPLSAGLAAFL